MSCLLKHCFHHFGGWIGQCLQESLQHPPTHRRNPSDVEHESSEKKPREKSDLHTHTCSPRVSGLPEENHFSGKHTGWIVFFCQSSEVLSPKSRVITLQWLRLVGGNFLYAAEAWENHRVGSRRVLFQKIQRRQVRVGILDLHKLKSSARQTPG